MIKRSVYQWLCLFCAVGLLICALCGCHSSDGDGTEPGQDRADTTDFATIVQNAVKEMRGDLYALRKLDFPDGYTPVDSKQRRRWMSVFGDRIVCCAYDARHAFSYFVFAQDGELLDTVPQNQIPKPDGMTVEYYCPQEDGSALISASDDQMRVICIYAPDGTLRVQSSPIEVRESAAYTVLAAAGDYILYGESDGSVWLYDSTLTLLCEDRLQTTAEYAVSGAENVFTVICENGTAYIYDAAAGVFSECVLYEENEISRAAKDILYTGDGVFFTDHDAVTAVWDGVPSQILDWEASGYRMTDMEFVQAVGKDSFLVRYCDRLRGETYPALLVHREPEEVIVPETIRVASVGIRVQAERDPRQILYESTLAFNRENPYYCIELTDYDAAYYGDVGSSTPLGGRADTRFDTFERDLTAGKTYDVYLIGPEYENTAALEEKNLFADVRRLCEGTDYITALQSAWNTGAEDAVYRIPMSMTASALVTPSDTLTPGGTFTYDTLIALGDSLPTGEALFSDDVADELFSVSQYDFIDEANKTCSFDSPEYVRFLDFCSMLESAVMSGNVNAYYDYSLGRSTDASFIPDALIDSLKSGRLKFFKWNMNSLQSLTSFYFLNRAVGGNLTFCGYPTAAGGSLYAETDVTMALANGLSLGSGAYEYLEFLLSDTVQTAPALTDYALPVTRGALDKLLLVGYHYYSDDADSLARAENGIRIHCETVTSLPMDAMEQILAFYNHEIQVTQAERDRLYRYLCETDMRGASDTMIRSIIEEELSYVSQGVRTAEEAGKIIQSRVFIYINE